MNKLVIAGLAVLVIALLVVSYLLILPLVSPAGRLKVEEFGGKVRIWYGEGERNFVDLYLSDGNRTKLVVFVHGGGFRGGTASGASAKVITRFFREIGFSVVSIEYRVCPEHQWPTPLEDIARGIKAAFQYLKERSVEVDGAVYIGSSAGAIAGALLIYGPDAFKYGVSRYFNGYIGLSGGYCTSVATKDPREEFEACGVPIRDIMPFDSYVGDPEKVPALLIGGLRDTLLDRFAGKGNVNHQVECMASYLGKYGVRVTKVYIEGGHGEPIRRILGRDPLVIEALFNFLGDIGLGDC
ncbi:MAG: alpha/beta hydrolase [Candidatus Korarchaeota archaeon]|nr:alpha/beta hydrolase [Candidatus Korarchaeota archaeon]